MQLHGQNIIGDVLSRDGKSTLQATDPSCGITLDPFFYEATEAETHRAVVAASQAFEEYRRLPAEAIAIFLEAIADEILQLGDGLFDRITKETALGYERLVGERARTTNQLRSFAALVREGSWVEASIDTAQPERSPVPKPDLRRKLVPLGPVAVFGASNFPLAFSVAGGDTASALAAGNPVVVKAHPAHPGTSELVGEAVRRAALKSEVPAGVFSMVHGASPEVSMRLVEHPLIKAVGFTGSYKVGRILFDAANARSEPIPVFAEMGSVNPVFVLPDAMATRGEAIANGLHASVTTGAGQFCTCPGLVVAPASEPLESMKSTLSKLFESTVPSTMLHAGIQKSFTAGVGELQRISGVEVASATEPADVKSAQGAAVLFSADASTFLGNELLGEELFGPSTVLVTCEKHEELMQIARGLKGHLTATIHATDKDLHEFSELIAVLENRVGRLIFNGFPTGVEVCPSMQHGGPFPATTDSRFTSVGSGAIKRFARPVCYQNFPQQQLPVELRDRNERNIWRMVNNEWTKADVSQI